MFLQVEALEIPEAANDYSDERSASATNTSGIGKTAASSTVQTKSLEGSLRFKVDKSEGKVGNIFYLYIALRVFFFFFSFFFFFFFLFHKKYSCHIKIIMHNITKLCAWAELYVNFQ